jgi:hypothetical protein
MKINRDSEPRRGDTLVVGIISKRIKPCKGDILLNREQNPEECDATKMLRELKLGYKKFI